MDTLKATIAVYDRLAAQYVQRNQHNGLWVGDSTQIDRFAGHLSASARVLDLGCGPGHDVVNLRNKGFYVTGADLSIGMLSQALAVAQGSPLLQADMRYLPFADASFDGVWACASMLHLPRQDVPRTLANITRVLRPQGKLYLSVKQGSGEVETHNLGTRHFTLFQPDEIEALVQAAGLTPLEQWFDSHTDVTWIGLVAARI